MSNEIAVVNTNQLPATLRARIGTASSISDNMTAGIGGSSFKRISKRNGRFRIRDGKLETLLPTLKLRTVIVGASPTMTKTFFKGNYDPNAEDTGPTCWSNDGVRPAADVEDPQSQLCANCPQNVWGSKVIEGSTQKLKACSDQKKLAVIFADDQSPNPEVYLYQVSPSELSGFHAYGKQLEARGFPVEVVVTEISFVDDAHHPKVQFKFGGFVDEELLPVIDELVGSSQVKEITGQTTPVVKDLGPAPVRKAGVQEIEEVEVVLEPRANTPKAKPAAADIKEPQAGRAVKSSSLAGNDLQDILNSLKNGNYEDAVVEEI